MAENPQSYRNHARLDPLFHYFVAPVAAINVGVAFYAMVRRPSYSDLWFLILSIAFAAAVLKTRNYALRVQDRVIRMEETHRLRHLLPAEEHGLIEKLHPHHFIALRFASDEELPGLARQTVANRWGPKDVKGAIQQWRADHIRI